MTGIIAFRNLIRNKRRSLIVLTSIIVGVAALLISDTFGSGMMYQMLDNQIGMHTTHLQIHKSGFNDNKIVANYLPDAGKVEDALKNIPEVKSYSRRIINFGMLSSANNSSGALIVGVEPEKEKQLTNIHKHITSGEYLSGDGREIVIGSKMADKLELEIGDKVVAVASDINGNVSNELFRVKGIFSAGSREFDELYIYMPLSYAQTLLGLEGKINEIALVAEEAELAVVIDQKLESMLGDDYEVLNYKELLPMLISYVDIYKASIWIFYAIIGIAVIFGVVNTMLMSVFERIQEFGVLMSIGMKNIKIFLMVLAEAFYLGVIGTAIGFAAGYIIFLYFEANGLDLSAFSDSLNQFGLGTVIYPALNRDVLLNVLLIIPFTTVVGAIYPAVKAIRLSPTNAMRYV